MTEETPRHPASTPNIPIPANSLAHGLAVPCKDDGPRRDEAGGAVEVVLRVEGGVQEGQVGYRLSEHLRLFGGGLGRGGRVRR